MHKLWKFLNSYIFSKFLISENCQEGHHIVNPSRNGSILLYKGELGGRPGIRPDLLLNCYSSPWLSLRMLQLVMSSTILQNPYITPAYCNDHSQNKNRGKKSWEKHVRIQVNYFCHQNQRNINTANIIWKWQFCTVTFSQIWRPWLKITWGGKTSALKTIW